MADQTSKEYSFCELAKKLKVLKEDEIKYMKKWIKKGMIYSPYIWQDILSKKGKIKFVDGHGYDFEDFSEAKTSSLTYRTSGIKGYRGRITNVGGKKSYLRVAIYNEFLNVIEYFLIPPESKCKVTRTSYKSPMFGINYSYNTTTQRYSNNLELYRVKSINEVCQQVS